MVLILLFPVSMDCDAVEASVIWACEATGRQRSYRTMALERGAGQFQLMVYNAPHYRPGAYQETIPIALNASQKFLMGVGHTSDGELIQVEAFRNGGVAFRVRDRTGWAIGHCVRDLTEN